MTLQLLANILLIAVLICWIGYRQLTWRPVAVAQLWRFPAVLGVVGLALLAQTAHPSTVTVLDLGVLAVELVISLAIGAWMGAIARFRPLETPVRTGRDGRFVAAYESQTGALGLVLWVVVIVVRLGIDVLAGMAGSHLAASTGVILLMFAANRAARAAVFASRLDRHATATV
jgi:hypothetical protein